MSESKEPLTPTSSERFTAAFTETPNAEAAQHLAESVLAAAQESAVLDLDALAPEASDRLEQILLALCGTAPFLAPMLRRHPEWLAALVSEPLDSPRTRDEFTRRLDADWPAKGEVDEAGELAALRRFKYAELARITVRDCTPELVSLAESEVTLRELSELADVLLDRAFQVARTRMRAQYGPPEWPLEAGGSVELGFCALGLGKLGSEELNYSSDVDLVYIHETPPRGMSTPNPDDPAVRDGVFARLAPSDYFTRLAQTFGRLVTTQTADGFLYRIDVDLRPEGAQGTLVVADDTLATYYEAWADTWEKAAFMKARPVAGDLALGWRAIQEVAPMIYRSSMDFAAVESIRTLKSRVADAKGGGRFNVKIDPGGIRDVEFVAQALQLLHGARIPQIRERSTMRSLRKLREVGLVAGDRCHELLDAYLFLRRTENRLQMAAERQVHLVPNQPAALENLARAMGYTGKDASEDFSNALSHACEIVLRPLEQGLSTDCREHILALFTRNAPSLLKLDTTRNMIESLATGLANAIQASPDRELALNNIDRFIESLGSRHFYYELLLDRPELIPRLTELFAVSKYLSNFVASHPALIEPLFENPNVLLLSPKQLEEDLASVEATCTGGDPHDEEGILNALRLFHHRQVVNVGLLDVGGEIERPLAESALTDLAEVCLRRALDFAEMRAARRKGGVPDAARDGSYLVVGAGKLGSRELSYGSDLDLFFIYDAGEAEGPAAMEAQSYFATLSQRLISALQTTTAEGTCYEIDTRLRPSGSQGMLVSSLRALRRYHDETAELWERQALQRARPVAGDPGLAAAFNALRLEVLNQPLPESPRQKIRDIRQRMENELARETQARHNFKTGRGGLLDIETVVQFLVLTHGPMHPELFEVARVEDLLASLGRLGLLDETSIERLTAGWSFLQGLAARLRIVENRSISDLDEERGDLEGLARRLGYEQNSREGSARRALLNDYRTHTDAIREIYDRIMRPEEDPALTTDEASP